MNTLYEKIKSEAESTIGYSEAENKESFMVGVSVAFSKAEKAYSEKIKELTSALEGYKSSYEYVNKDMKTLAAIISRYSNE